MIFKIYESFMQNQHFVIENLIKISPDLLVNHFKVNLRQYSLLPAGPLTHLFSHSSFEHLSLIAKLSFISFFALEKDTKNLLNC